MKEIYIIEFEEFRCYLHSDRDSDEKSHVLGVFDTGRRAICYLRRFLDEGDYDDYYGKRLDTSEDENGYVSAKAVRRYKFKDCNGETLVTETMKMKRVAVNGCKSPEEEILGLYC